MATEMNIYRIDNGQLVKVDDCIPNGKVWAAFANNIIIEPALTKYSAETLQKRFLSGLSAIVIGENGEIISHTSLIPITENDKWRAAFPDFPIDTKIFEVATGWTISSRRHKKINTNIRIKLLSEHGGDSLFMNYCRGIGTSKIVNELGWKIIPWDKYPYVSSLIGWFEKSQYYKTRYGFCPSDGKKPFNEYEIDFLSHDWDKYYHLWASNREKAIEMDNIFQKRYKDIESWRTELKNIFPS